MVGAFHFNLFATLGVLSYNLRTYIDVSRQFGFLVLHDFYDAKQGKTYEYFTHIGLLRPVLSWCSQAIILAILI